MVIIAMGTLKEALIPRDMAILGGTGGRSGAGRRGGAGVAAGSQLPSKDAQPYSAEAHASAPAKNASTGASRPIMHPAPLLQEKKDLCPLSLWRLPSAAWGCVPERLGCCGLGP